MYKILIIVVLGICSFSCKNEIKKEVVSSEVSVKKYPEIEALQWLVGDWSNTETERKSYERWKQKNDSTLTSFSYTMVANDTVFAERLILQQNPKGVFLTVQVPDQNEAEAVTFQQISTPEGVFRFGNEAHDFPKYITYTNPVNDSIHAWIEGEIEGENQKIDFFFKRDN
ncbi:DUF6265 family protein [Ulvibacter litoralis]|uniref:DUF6265 domain-containing protein n=1 Tax=Ulvibacter litoralis TaxID=227084 RepID=A0A1G7GXT9_9FLAO|nr:DUF6265 family protein [Ulvibacter litoralis]GHC59750.1 hypothetical protein GCM10008083_25850 [Ulvibacter litoralis]SDE92884.1 hypothetical protein SAMN05421855_103385 [Ulvibacter litoralis]